MEINLSNEMIEKITCVAFGRKQALRKRIELVETTKAETDRKREIKEFRLKKLNESLSDATEVHELFLGIMKELEIIEED